MMPFVNKLFYMTWLFSSLRVAGDIQQQGNATRLKEDLLKPIFRRWELEMICSRSKTFDTFTNDHKTLTPKVDQIYHYLLCK